MFKTTRAQVFWWIRYYLPEIAQEKIRSLGKFVFNYWFILVLFPAVIIPWFYFGGYAAATNPETNSFNSGAINTLFAGLAFAGMLCTLIIQSRELSLQRKELQLTREATERGILIEAAKIRLVELENLFKEHAKMLSDLDCMVQNNDDPLEIEKLKERCDKFFFEEVFPVLSEPRDIHSYIINQYLNKKLDEAKYDDLTL